MKKCILKLFFSLGLVLLSSACFSKEITIGEVECLEYKNNNYYKRTLRLRYDGNYYLQVNSSYETSWIDLGLFNDSEAMETMRKNFDKFFEWTDIARKNSTDVSKEIPDSKIFRKVAWRSGNDYYESDFPLSIQFSVVTSSNGDVSILLFYSTEVPSNTNRYITFETGNIVLSESNVKSLREIFKKSNIEAKIQAEETAEAKQKELFK